jgi:hypothetical protein
MEQQQVHSDESTAYTTGYEEVPRTYNDFPDSHGQKLSPHEHQMSPTAGQRFILAIVSLVLLTLALIAVILLADFTTHNEIQFGIVFFYLVLLAAIVVNVKFNRKR